MIVLHKMTLTLAASENIPLIEARKRISQHPSSAGTQRLDSNPMTDFRNFPLLPNKHLPPKSNTNTNTSSSSILNLNRFSPLDSDYELSPHHAGPFHSYASATANRPESPNLTRRSLRSPILERARLPSDFPHNPPSQRPNPSPDLPGRDFCYAPNGRLPQFTGNGIAWTTQGSRKTLRILVRTCAVTFGTS